MELLFGMMGMRLKYVLQGRLIADKFITILNRTKNPYKGSIARSNNERPS